MLGPSTPMVDPDWLMSRLHDPTVRVVEVDVSSAAYDEGHIPGAALWNAYSDLRGPDFRPVGREELARLLSRAGVTPQSTLVFYGYGAALGFWLMKAHGHEDVRMLLGSRDAWTRSGGPWSAEVPEPADSHYRLAPVDDDLLATRADVEAALGQPGHVVLDVRAGREYDGEFFWPSGAAEESGRPGHIPGAISFPIDGIRSDGERFEPPEELRRTFERAGIAPDDKVIVYCTIGNRASQAWYALTYLLGHPGASVYYGSWVEWGKATDTPVEGSPAGGTARS